MFVPKFVERYFNYNFPKAEYSYDLKSRNLRTLDYYIVELNLILINDSVRNSITSLIKKNIINFKRYQKVQEKIGLKWPFIFAIHYLEANCNFNKNLHNGQNWNQVTTIAPIGVGPFRSWEESTIDALKQYTKYITFNSLEEYLFIAERHNGFGYANLNTQSPYVFAGSSAYVKGKFTYDGKYDPNAVSKQFGVAPILLIGQELGLWDFSRADFNSRDLRYITYRPKIYSDSVKIFQEAVNKIISQQNLPYKKLTVDGFAGDTTSAMHKELFLTYLFGDPRQF